jgi:hypothetical protein
LRWHGAARGPLLLCANPILRRRWRRYRFAAEAITRRVGASVIAMRR